MAKTIAIKVEIENIRSISTLKKELKALRKEQRQHEKEVKTGRFQTNKSTKAYVLNAKAIKDKSTKLRQLNKAMNTSTNESKRVTKSSNGMAKQFVKGAAAIGIIVTAFRMVSRVVSSVVSTFSEFEFTMAKVRAVSGATDREFEQLTLSAEELGRTTFFTAKQVGDLQLAYSKLGFTSKEIMDATKATLDLAAATGTDLERASQVAGAAVRGFGLDASETERVVDVMAVSFASSAMSIEKWQTSMTKVAPIAKAAGFSIEDTAAIMSKLTDSGIEASIAGTSLRNILLKMQDPTSELSMRFGTTIHSLDELVPAMKKFIKEGGSMADVMEVVDLRQAAAFEQMITTADGTLELRDALLEAGGEGSRMADMVGNTLQGAFLKFKSALQGLSISLMKDYAKSLTKSIENGAKWLNNIIEYKEQILKGIKVLTIIIKTLGIYKVGVMAASVATKIAGSAQIAYTGAVTLSSKATKLFTASLVVMKAALIKTGIGALVVLMAELAYAFFTFNEEAQKATNWIDLLNKGIDEEESSVDALEQSMRRLEKAKKTVDKFTKEEVKNMNKVSLEYKLYSEQLIIATQETNILNGAFRENGQDLITLETNIEDTKDAFGDLAVQMRNTAAISVSTELNKDLIKTKIQADRFVKAMIEKSKEANMENTEEEILALAEKMKNNNWLQDYLTSGWVASVSKAFPTGLIGLSSWIASEGVSMESLQLMRDMSEEMGVNFGDILEFSGKAGELNLDEQLKSVNDEIRKLIPNYEDFISLKDDEGEGGVLGLDAVNWANEMVTAMNKVKKKRAEGIIDEKQYAKEVLEVKHEQYKKELNAKATKNKRENVLTGQMLDIEIQLNKINFDKEKLLEEEKLGLSIQSVKDKYTIMGVLTGEGAAKIQELEAAHLILMGKLHTDYAMTLIGNNLKIQQSNAEVAAQNLKTLHQQLGALGGVGGALTSLAGDNEKLNKVKEIGIKITQAASIAESVLTLTKNLGVIADGKALAASALLYVQKLLNIKANVAEGISSQAKIQFPFNIIAILATMAILKRVMKFKEGGIVEGGEKFADGGMVNGKSHAQGGEKFAVGGRVAELEGGEAVINKRSTAMFKSQLSAMNAAGGGVKFADGGLMNMPSFASSQFNAIGQQNMMGAMNRNNKVVVVESDITTSQNTVEVIEAEATF